MLRKRIIPCLLMKNAGLYKGEGYRNHRYIGDPINVAQIFNSKEADEILLLDITATDEGRTPSAQFIQRIADQCLMPFAVGGGIRTVEQAQALLAAGAEKVCLNSAAFEDPGLVHRIAGRFGSQAVMVSIDVKKSFFGKKEVYTHCGKRKVKGTPCEWAVRFEEEGAGEILLNDIDLDGAREGYNIPLACELGDAVKIPVIAACGAGSNEHIRELFAATKASAAAAGSLFVFHGPRQAVLISYPNEADHEALFTSVPCGSP